jgi:hypothetical protein
MVIALQRRSTWLIAARMPFSFRTARPSSCPPTRIKFARQENNYCRTHACVVHGCLYPMAIRWLKVRLPACVRSDSKYDPAVAVPTIAKRPVCSPT